MVDDSSSPQTIDAYEEIKKELDDRFTFHYLPSEISRKSPSVTRNYGVSLAESEYVAFCDDDDRWIEKTHLEAAYRFMEQVGSDLFIADMRSTADGRTARESWYSENFSSIQKNHTVIGIKLYDTDDFSNQVFLIPEEIRHLFLRGVIIHANVIVIKKKFFQDIGGYWDRLAFAEDEDFGIRAFDKANIILYRDRPVAEIDVGWHPSVARDYLRSQQSILGVSANLHAASVIKNATLRKELRKGRSWKLLEVAEQAINRGEYGLGREFASESLRIHPSRTGILMLLKSLKIFRNRIPNSLT